MDEDQKYFRKGKLLGSGVNTDTIEASIGNPHDTGNYAMQYRETNFYKPITKLNSSVVLGSN